MSDTPIRDCELTVEDNLLCLDDTEIVAKCYGERDDDLDEYARVNATRFAACWNLMRHIPTESLNDQFWRAVELCARHANWCADPAVEAASDLLTKLCRQRKSAIQ